MKLRLMPLGDDFDGKADIYMDGGLVLNEMELGVPLELAAEIVRRYNAHERLVAAVVRLLVHVENFTPEVIDCEPFRGFSKLVDEVIDPAE